MHGNLVFYVLVRSELCKSINKVNVEIFHGCKKVKMENEQKVRKTSKHALEVCNATCDRDRALSR